MGLWRSFQLSNNLLLPLVGGMLHIAWRVLVRPFPFIRDWVMWRIGNGRAIRLGLGLWASVGDDYLLSENFISPLKNESLFPF